MRGRKTDGSIVRKAKAAGESGDYKNPTLGILNIGKNYVTGGMPTTIVTGGMPNTKVTGGMPIILIISGLPTVSSLIPSEMKFWCK